MRRSGPGGRSGAGVGGVSIPTGERALVLFLSNGFSLLRWREEGLQTREMLIYREFLRTGVFDRVDVFSYNPADHGELERLRRLDPIWTNLHVITPPAAAGELRGARAAAWSAAGVAAHLGRLRRASWLKTNQLSGSWTAVLAARLTGRPLLVRQGYSLSNRFRRVGQSRRERMARRLEQVAYGAAMAVAVTSHEAARLIAQDHPRQAAKVRVLPTYVDTTLFAPKSDYDWDTPVVFVGRLEPVKNVVPLIEACRSLGRPLDLYGLGSQEAECRALAAQPGSIVKVMGNVPNEQLADRLRRHTVFALPSTYEGLPKALIEAMALGLVCVGTDTTGINELIVDERNGYLVPGTTPEAIAARLRHAFEQRNDDLGRAARDTIEQGFSLERYAAGERAIYEQAA